MSDIDIVDKWLEYMLINKGRSARTADKYRLYLGRLVEYCQANNISLLQASSDHLEVFTGVYVFKQMDLSARTRRTVVAAVRGFYSWCAFKNLVNQNPATNLAYPKAPQTIPVALPLDAAEKLMWAPDLTTFLGVRDAAILSVLIGCGLRVSGVIRLNESDLVWSRDGDREQLSVKAYEKGNKERLVPAPDETRLLIRAYLGHESLASVNRNIAKGDKVLFISTCNRMVMPGDFYGEVVRLGARSINKIIVKYGEKLNIPGEYLHPHALRHLYGVELTEDSVDVLDRMALMGHKDPQSNEIYSHIAQRKLRKIIDRSNPLQKINTPVSSLSKILQQDNK